MPWQSRIITDDNFNFNSTGQTPLVLYVGPQGSDGQCTQFNVQASVQTHAWSTAVLSIEYSIDGQGWVLANTLGPAAGPATLINGPASCSTNRYIRVRVSTAEGSASTGRVTIIGTDTTLV